MATVRRGRLVFALDPEVEVPFDEVVIAAKELKERLERGGLVAFCQTTCGKGLHVVAPIVVREKGGLGWDEAKAFAQVVDCGAALIAAAFKRIAPPPPSLTWVMSILALSLRCVQMLGHIQETACEARRSPHSCDAFRNSHLCTAALGRYLAGIIELM
jgi:hypothetical protein